MAFFQLSGWISGVHNWVFWIINIKTYKYSIRIQYNRILAWWKEYNPCTPSKESFTLAKKNTLRAHSIHGHNCCAACTRQLSTHSTLHYSTKQTTLIEHTHQMERESSSQIYFLVRWTFHFDRRNATRIRRKRPTRYGNISDRIAGTIKKLYDRKKCSRK